MAPSARASASLTALLAGGPVARSNRLALTLGVAAISLTLLVGLLAFQRGRSAIAQGYVEAAQREASWYARVLEVAGDDRVHPEYLRYLEADFRKRNEHSPQSFLVAYDARGIVRLDTRNQERVGLD